MLTWKNDDLFPLNSTHILLSKTGYELDHTAYHAGYVTRKNDNWNGESKKCYIEEYDGRFGKGYKLHTPTYNSTFFHVVEYWIRKEGE